MTKETGSAKNPADIKWKPGTVYEVKGPGGLVCVDGSDVMNKVRRGYVPTDAVMTAGANYDHAKNCAAADERRKKMHAEAAAKRRAPKTPPTPEG